jgi:hypothetical protein
VHHIDQLVEIGNESLDHHERYGRLAEPRNGYILIFLSAWSIKFFDLHGLKEQRPCHWADRVRVRAEFISQGTMQEG